jgi:hypothetical protein
VSDLLRSLRSLILGDTWTIPAGVVVAVGGALLLREALPGEVWSRGGGFALALLVVATLLASLRERS